MKIFTRLSTHIVKFDVAFAHSFEYSNTQVVGNWRWKKLTSSKKYWLFLRNHFFSVFFGSCCVDLAHSIIPKTVVGTSATLMKSVREHHAEWSGKMLVSNALMFFIFLSHLLRFMLPPSSTLVPKVLKDARKRTTGRYHKIFIFNSLAAGQPLFFLWKQCNTVWYYACQQLKSKE